MYVSEEVRGLGRQGRVSYDVVLESRWVLLGVCDTGFVETLV